MEELQQKAGKEKIEVEAPSIDEGLIGDIRSSHGQALIDAIATEGKLERYEAIDNVKDEVVAKYAAESDGGETDEKRVAEVKTAFGSIEKDTIRKAIAVDKKRPDGRAQDEIRPIECEVDISPRVHGSALFTRGETQILSNVALGTTRMDMRIDTLGLQTTKRFWHHYNFPPFSVGEAGFMRGPKRRDIGHGALAERALVATVPDEESFPYVIRAVSETLESNGSSSMGSVCASSMALQAAGVPVSAPVAGVAMGLIKEGEDYIVLTDIAGVEDHLGDMDFKVAGTAEGITALQMDIKITGVTFEILTDALEQANKGRQFILGKMAEAIDGPREKLSQHAPRIEAIKIDQEKIGAVIGKGGETIRALCEEFEAEIDVEDDGTVRIYAPTGDLVEACVARIESMTKEAEVGDRYNAAKVVKTTTFGAFVELVKGTDGLLHISNVKPGERVDSVDDVLSSGDVIDVTVVEVDRERGRIGLRLSEDPSVAGKSPEELASVGSGDGGPRRNGGDRDARPRRRSQARARAAQLDVERGEANRAGLGRPGRDRGGSLGSLGRARALGPYRIARRDARPGGRLALPRAPAVQGNRALLRDRDLRAPRRARRLGQRRHRQGDHAPARPLPRRAHRGGLRPAGGDAPRPDLPRNRLRARGRARGDRDVRGRAAGPRPRHPRRGGLRRAPARPPGAGRGRGDRLDPGARDRGLPQPPLHRLPRRRRRRRPPRARGDRRPRRATGLAARRR